MITEKIILVEARSLFYKYDWCQNQYALKEGKTLYNYLHEPADAYSIDGAINYAAHFIWALQYGSYDGMLKVHYEKLAVKNRNDASTCFCPGDYNAHLFSIRCAHNLCNLITKHIKWNDCLADWNDQDKEKELLEMFVNGLKKKQTPRDKAKAEINKFKQELKAMNIAPMITKAKVTLVLDEIIKSL